jgi:CO/xanthine dehydrogenase Mo-binding subunit
MTTSNSDDGIGGTVNRNEDHRVLTGNSTGTDDYPAPDALHVQFLRSEKAHARFTIDASDARTHSDVVAVYTAGDIDAGETPTPEPFPIYGAPMEGVPYPDDAYLQRHIAAEKARYQGEIIGVVVATDKWAARDALDDIDVTYDELDPVMTTQAALADDAPVIHDSVSTTSCSKAQAVTRNRRKPTSRQRHTPQHSRKVHSACRRVRSNHGQSSQPTMNRWTRLSLSRRHRFHTVTGGCFHRCLDIPNTRWT